MARNGSGTYAKVNTFVAGNTITAAGHNENWDDLVTEMTNSVAADGQTTMTGQVKGSNGTKTAPSFSFGSDLDTGMYRIGTNNLGLSCGDTKIFDISTTGATITGTLAATSDFAIATNKFTVAGATGNTVVAGTLGVTGDVAVATNKFNVTATNGNTTVAGTLGVTGDVAVNTNKFTVAASTGNTVVAGTLNVTGVATLTGGVSGLIAAQSDQETGTSTTLAVSPGRQQFHKSAAKFVLVADVAGTFDSTHSYNITAINDVGTGTVDVSVATDFSNSAYAILVSHYDDSPWIAHVDTGAAIAAGSFRIVAEDGAGTPGDPTNYFSAGFGDQ